jgi:hypothetical protein
LNATTPAGETDILISYTYRLAFEGGWAAKTIGCTYGGPVEFLHNGTMIQDYTPIKWSKDRVKYYYDTFPGLYDDIYVDIVFVNVFDRLGLEAPADSFAVSFADAGFPLWQRFWIWQTNNKWCSVRRTSLKNIRHVPL